MEQQNGGNGTPTPTRGVPIELDRVRYLRYTLGSLRRIREEYGTDALKDGVSEEKLAKVIWYGLKTDDPTLKVEDVEDLVDMTKLAALTEAIGKAMGGKAKAEIVPLAPAVTESPAATEPVAG